MAGIVRTIIGVIIIIILGIIFRKTKLQRKTRIILTLVTGITLWELIAFIPFENAFITFRTPQDAYSYSTFFKTPSFVIEGDKICLVSNIQTVENNFLSISSDINNIKKEINNKNEYLLFLKKDSGYKLVSSFDSKFEAKIIGNISIMLFHINGIDDYIVCVQATSYDDDFIVSDCCNNDFTKVLSGENGNIKIISFYSSIGQKNSNYYIEIDGKRYYIF